MDADPKYTENNYNGHFYERMLRNFIYVLRKQILSMVAYTEVPILNKNGENDVTDIANRPQ